MLDLVELFTHWHAGRSQVQLSASLGIDRKTVRKYLAPAIADGIEPGGEPLGADQWAELIAGWFPELCDPAARASTWPLIAPHQDRIKDWLDADVTVATIAQRLRDEHEVAASESSVRRWIAIYFADEVAREKVTVPRGPVDPGSEAQIDYGRLGMWFDPATAKRVAVWAFVMVLSCSRHMFVRPVIRMDQTTWCACHVAAFEFFGGVPARLVCDNLKTGVDKLDWMRTRLTPHPWRCFEQPLQLTNEMVLQSIPQSHISSTLFLSLRDADGLREKWDGRLWDIDTGHDMMITEPNKVAELLDRVARLVSGQ